MISFIYFVKNIKVVELGCFGDVIFDVCYYNIVFSDEIWYFVVEMIVFFVICLQRDNFRSLWYMFFLFVICSIIVCIVYVEIVVLYEIIRYVMK